MTQLLYINEGAREKKYRLELLRICENKKKNMCHLTGEWLIYTHRPVNRH